jgi:putative endonuclease
MSLRQRLGGLLARSTTERGRAAEGRALEDLLERGYRLHERNHRNVGGELDLILTEGETLVFVEVKYRLDGRYGGAVSAVDRDKRRRLCRASKVYLAATGWGGPCRFDVVTVENVDGALRTTLYRDAFYCDGH